MKIEIKMIEKTWLWLKMFGIYLYDKVKNNNDWNEIIPKLYVGNCLSAFDKEFLKNHNIGMIVNCTKEIPYRTTVIDDLKIKTIRIPVLDDKTDKEINRMSIFLPEVYEDIKKFYDENNKKILIHCFAGKQRSAICASYFIHRYLNISKDDSIKLLKVRRDGCFIPKINFYNSL